MKLQSVIPDPSIADYISKIFVIEDCKLLPGMGFPFIANGYPGFVFQTASSELVTSKNKKADHLFLFGQTIEPVELYTTGHLTLIAYFFHPPVLKTLFGFNANELTDTSIDLNQLQPAKEMNLKEQLINATSLNERLHLMNNYVSKLIRANHSTINSEIFFAAKSMQRNKGLASLRNIQNELRVSERTFRRLFDSHIGVSPKLFSRICQFDSAFQQLNQNQFSKLSDVAYENGYADQSHFLRSFKAFTSYSPSEYLKNSSDFLLLNS